MKNFIRNSFKSPFDSTQGDNFSETEYLPFYILNTCEVKTIRRNQNFRHTERSRSIGNFIFGIVFLFFSITTSFSQESLYNGDHLGFNAGINIAFGTHFQRLGLVLNAYYVYDHVQVNAETRFYFSLKNLGPKKHYGEAVTSLGLLYGYGDDKDYYNPFLNSVSNQTDYRNSFAYSYNIYWNKIRTTQRTGIIALQFDKISIITENDLLAPPSLDRFRTAAFLVQYQYKNLIQASVNCTMWAGKMGFKTASTDPHFYFGCYMDTTGSVYPNYSHGLLSAQVKYNLGYSQNVQANIGVDAEQVRNVVQNKIIHDMRFLPKKWIKHKNCHIPMLDDKGEQYLYKEGQKIKPAKVYLNCGSNEGLFY